MAYYLPGATTTKNGMDRFRADLALARSVWWGFPVIGVRDAVRLTNMDLGTNFQLPNQLSNLDRPHAAFKTLQRIRIGQQPGFNYGPKVVTVFYAPFSTETQIVAVGAAFANSLAPDTNSPLGRHDQIIFLSNEANFSSFPHELGHILFGTTYRKVNGMVVPDNNSCDPSSPKCSSDHSPTIIFSSDGVPIDNTNNVMNSPSGEGTSVLPIQFEKAVTSFLFESSPP